jgi:hypothetical protein
MATIHTHQASKKWDTNQKPMWFNNHSWYGYRSKRSRGLTTIALEIERPFYRPPYDGRYGVRAATYVVKIAHTR